MVLVFAVAAQTVLGQDVEILIGDVDIEDYQNKDSHWFPVQVRNTTINTVTVNGVQAKLSFESPYLSILEVEKDNTDFSNSTFSSNVANPITNGSISEINISVADATGVELADGSIVATTAIIAWVRVDPSNMHVDTRHDMAVDATIGRYPKFQTRFTHRI